MKSDVCKLLTKATDLKSVLKETVKSAVKNLLKCFRNFYSFLKVSFG